MKEETLKYIKKLHKKVIHAKDHSREANRYTDVEYALEDRKIKSIKSNEDLKLICERCFSRG